MKHILIAVAVTMAATQAVASTTLRPATITKATIEYGQLVVEGRLTPNATLQLDGRHNTRADASGVFRYRLSYLPDDCIVEVRQLINTSSLQPPKRNAVIANCAPANFNWRGAWTPATAYATGDVVIRDGQTWRALRSSINKLPAWGADWAMLAARGEAGAQGQSGQSGMQGAQGERGEKGEKGDRGDTGPTGPAGQNGQNGAQGAVGAQGQTGPQGPAGPQGPQGQPGPQGPAGPLPVVSMTCEETLPDFKTIDAGQTLAFNSASCAPNTLLVGGNCFASTGDPKLVTSTTNSLNGQPLFMCRYVNDTQSQVTVFAQARCCTMTAP